LSFSVSRLHVPYITLSGLSGILSVLVPVKNMVDVKTDSFCQLCFLIIFTRDFFSKSLIGIFFEKGARQKLTI
jgi:hypothetical protein